MAPPPHGGGCPLGAEGSNSKNFQYFTLRPTVLGPNALDAGSGIEIFADTDREPVERNKE